MSYEVYIDVRHHPRHNDEDERVLSTALRLADPGLTDAHVAGDFTPIHRAVAECLRGFADALDGGKP